MTRIGYFTPASPPAPRSALRHPVAYGDREDVRPEIYEATSPLATINVAGVPFRCAPPEGAVEWLYTRIILGETEGLTLRFANAYSLASASRDQRYLELLADGGHNFADGHPVHWFMRLTDANSAQESHVRGPSFFRTALDRGRSHHIRHFFLGTTEETLGKLINEVTASFPGIEIAGSYAPPFGDMEQLITLCERRVREAQADIVWVALGSPKQDFVATELNCRTGIATAGVGAAFDFVAGTVREAPRLVQRIGMEWAYRLIAEPHRLWKRYLFGNSRFLIAASAGFSDARKQTAQRRPSPRPTSPAHGRP